MHCSKGHADWLHHFAVYRSSLQFTALLSVSIIVTAPFLCQQTCSVLKNLSPSVWNVLLISFGPVFYCSSLINMNSLQSAILYLVISVFIVQSVELRAVQQLFPFYTVHMHKRFHKFLTCVLFVQCIIFLYANSSFMSMHIYIKIIFFVSVEHNNICSTSSSSSPTHKGQFSLYIPVLIPFNIWTAVNQTNLFYL